MKAGKTIRLMVYFIVVLSFIAALSGMLSNKGPGEYNYQSIRGQSIRIYGKGLYQHMSSDVAIQGIAQDYVTLLVGIPMLLISLFLAGRGSLKGKFMLTGTLGYFMVTYIFYMLMGMYNELFLVYVSLASLGFYAFLLSVLSLWQENPIIYFENSTPVGFSGGFLIFCSIAIGMLWLSVVVPPLLNGTLYPVALEHYTTLIVQGMDLSILLPGSFIAGWLLKKRRPSGYLLAPVYMVFLSILMTALTAKIIGMSLNGVNAGPALVIIPLFNAVSIVCAVLLLRAISRIKGKSRSFSEMTVENVK